MLYQLSYRALFMLLECCSRRIHFTRARTRSHWNFHFGQHTAKNVMTAFNNKYIIRSSNRGYSVLFDDLYDYQAIRIQFEFRAIHREQRYLKAIHTNVIIIIMYIYHALINALSAHMIHINLNMIFYTHVKHSPTKTIYIKYYFKK